MIIVTTLFESSVILYGSQADIAVTAADDAFESSVILYGSQVESVLSKTGLKVEIFIWFTLTPPSC